MTMCNWCRAQLATDKILSRIVVEVKSRTSTERIQKYVFGQQASELVLKYLLCQKLPSRNNPTLANYELCCTNQVMDGVPLSPDRLITRPR